MLMGSMREHGVIPARRSQTLSRTSFALTALVLPRAQHMVLSVTHRINNDSLQPATASQHLRPSNNFTFNDKSTIH